MERSGSERALPGSAVPVYEGQQVKEAVWILRSGQPQGDLTDSGSPSRTQKGFSESSMGRDRNCLSHCSAFEA